MKTNPIEARLSTGPLFIMYPTTVQTANPEMKLTNEFNKQIKILSKINGLFLLL